MRESIYPGGVEQVRPHISRKNVMKIFSLNDSSWFVFCLSPYGLAHSLRDLT